MIRVRPVQAGVGLLLGQRAWLSRLDPGLLAAALLPLIGILPTLSDGVIRTADGPLHVHRIYAVTALLEHGQLWPRWVPWFHLGYGYPIFNFYPLGVFYLGGLLGLLGIAAPVAFNLVAALAWMTGSAGTYALAKRFLPGSAALLAAMLWAYAPSRLFEVWDQGSLPQMMAGALLPWALLGTALAAHHPGRRSVLAVALPFAGIILSHQPLTIIGGLFIGPAALLLPLAASWRDRAGLARRLAGALGGLALGVGLAAIFLLPLVFELRYVSAASQAPDVIPYLISNFLQPSEIISQPPAMDLTDLRFELPTTLGVIGPLLTLGGLAALARRRRGIALLLLAGLLVCIFMMLEISLPVWQTIPFMAQLRFPERFLRVASIFIALAGGACLLLIPARWRTAALAAGLTATLIAALPLVYPNQSFVTWDNLSALDEIRMEETEHIWGTTSYDEFNPIWGEKPGWDPAVEPEEYVTDPLRIVVNRLDMIRQWPDLQVEQISSSTVRVIAANPRPVRFRQFYFPGWTATRNGEPAVIYPEDEVGQITIDVPAGEHIISLAYTGTPIQAVGTVITLLSLGLAGALFFTGRASQTSFAPGENLPLRLAGAISAAVIVAAVVNTAFITPNTLWFRHRSPLDQPVYMQTPVNVSFGGTFTLLGYTVLQDSARPGGLFEIMLFWRAERPLDREYRPIVQLVNLTTTEAWAVSEPFFPGGGHTDRGYPLDRFASEVHSMRVFDMAPPYVGRVSVQMVTADTGQPLTLPGGAARLLLDPLIRIQGDGPPLADALGYRFDDRVALRCAVVTGEAGTYRIALGWHVLNTPAQNVTAFVHGLDASGEVITQNDSAPLGGDYPAVWWLPGQNLLDRHTLPADPAITAIAVGLYTPERRLSLARDGQPVPDDRVLLTLTEKHPCQP